VGRRALDDDIAVVAAVRGAIGVHATLRLDANGAWSTDEAKTALRELAHFAPKFVEEPLREASLCGQFSSPVPIALDESLPDVVALEAAIARGGLAAVVLKLERVGGPLPALAMAARAWRAGLEVAFTDSIDGECGRAAVVHTAVAASARSGRPLAALGLGGLFLLDDGSTAVPIVDVGAPGLAVTLPTDFVAAAS
jgi:L-alanine-DL-glutamate epimerase-like enolase superfamily enzyme